MEIQNNSQIGHIGFTPLPTSGATTYTHGDLKAAGQTFLGALGATGGVDKQTQITSLIQEMKDNKNCPLSSLLANISSAEYMSQQCQNANIDNFSSIQDYFQFRRDNDPCWARQNAMIDKGHLDGGPQFQQLVSLTGSPQAAYQALGIPQTYC